MLEAGRPYISFSLCYSYGMLLVGLSADKRFKFHPRCSKLNITHLSFADDLLLFAKGDLASISALNQCFDQFSLASGLQANLAKSFLYFGGVSLDDQYLFTEQFDFSIGVLPFKYLGVPLSTKKLTTLQCQPLIDRIVARISSWTSKKLGTAGRIQLV